MSGLDERIHHPTRLQLCAMLAVVDEVEFAFVRDRLGVADSVLSKHAKLSRRPGTLSFAKVSAGGRRRTWFTLTTAGRRAFRAHVAELQRFADATADPALSDAGSRPRLGGRAG